MQMTTTAEKRKPIGGRKAGANRTTIACAFCGGTGGDPYGVLSKVSNCPVCQGHKTVEVETPTVPCAYCRGTGRQRHTRLTCSACKGKGVITLAGPTAGCPQCRGTGRMVESDLACSRCGGAGLIADESVEAGEQNPAAPAPQEQSGKQPNTKTDLRG